jgi:hypothetical protein
MFSNRLYGPAGAPGAAGQISLNTQATNQGPLPAKQTVLVNTETQIINPAVINAALAVDIPANSPLEQQQFQVNASGYLNHGTSSTITLRLYWGKSTTIASNTLLKSSGAVSAFSGKTNWWLKGEFIYDSVSGTLTGTVQFFVNNTLVSSAAITNVPTGLTGAGAGSGAPVGSFSLTAQWGTAGTQVINVQVFEIDA